MTKCIYIYCDGGLGNRYNCLMGGLWLAHNLNLTPQVIWPQNNWCGAAFEDLFEPGMQLCDHDYNQIFDLIPTINVIHENVFNRPLSFLQVHHTSLMEIHTHMAQMPHRHLFYLNSLIPAWMEHTHILDHIVTMLPFKKNLVDMAEHVMHLHAQGESFWGIHMRKTDFGDNAVSDLPYMNMIVANPDQKVFVCSDDALTEQKFNLLPNVFVHDKTHYVEKLVPGEWNQTITDQNQTQWQFNVNRSSASVQEAVVDLLILSHSNIMNTNTRSTFLHMASMLKESRKRWYSSVTSA